MSKVQQSFNVRFDSHTREALDVLAARSERTISQLVRYATLWWLETEERACPLHTVNDSVGNGRYVNVRYSPEVLVAISAAAAEMSISQAGVIRCAVRAWVPRASASALGEPSHAVSPGADGLGGGVLDKVPLAV